MPNQVAFLFDMDGVIIDSTALHTRAWEQYLAKHGIDAPYIESRMLGKHNDQIVREFFDGQELSADDVFQHGANKEALYRDLMKPVFAQNLVPGAIDFIKGHAGTPMAVATNAEAANAEFVLELAGIREHFQAVVNGQEIERPKPAPDIYLRAAELLKVHPRDCVVFEDSQTGVAAALAAGMRVVGVLTTLTAFDNVEISVRDFQQPELGAWLQSINRQY